MKDMSGIVLMVAAEAREFDGLVGRIGGRRLDWGLQFAQEAEWNGKRAILVAHGAGMRMAGRAADTARGKIEPDAVISIGFCGALDERLDPGVVLAASVVMYRETGAVYACATGGLAGCEIGPLVSQDRVAWTAAEKADLRRTGARVVEMEAAAVAERAQTWSVPFYCIKSVSDSAGEGFGIDFNRMRDDEGRFDRARIAISALARPWSRIPPLVRLDRNCRKAAQSLGEFLANCRF